MIRPAITAVFVAGPIIHLDELDCLYLIADFQENLLPESVWKEINQHHPSALKKSDLSLVRSSKNYPAGEKLHTMCRVFSLDAGETEALAILERNPDAIFFTDDAAARLVAEQMRFKVHGTIGIITRTIRRGLMKPQEVLRIPTEIPSKSSLYIKLSVLEKTILKIEKELGL